VTKIERAQAMAHAAHDSINQKRKYGNLPYWVHTDAVAEIVALHGGTKDMIAAAHLHDVLEDVQPSDKAGIYQAACIGTQFGEPVLRFVWELTNLYTKEARPGWNRAKRKEEEHKRLAAISDEAKVIKLADILDNAQTIGDDKEHLPFAVVWLGEKLHLLPLLKTPLASRLWDKTDKAVRIKFGHVSGLIYKFDL